MFSMDLSTFFGVEKETIDQRIWFLIILGFSDEQISSNVKRTTINSTTFRGKFKVVGDFINH